ncbi:hypothetical protein [Myxococcus sp. AS-1-15]|uniref:hypothetical protein n=1 Tax=Myxococcus sp. AS-1-15 TaxID=2874600 RepID=UPI001CBBAF4A|nr:hypothetical protein [Myxococcus sp. AS-1-15]MBZ4402481.1 hypothetical protein [Myxococcus sp. AS-1-15]BDT35555.1 response regulator [Myxococcus sp. MH1]
MMRVLAVEDNDPKWSRIEAVLRQGLGSIDVVRARDLRDAERLVEEGGWDLLILDISLDIRAGGDRGGRGAHDYTGGLKIAGRMFYLECEVPTIVVTGFDAFPTAAPAAGHEVILGLEDVGRQARRFLGHHLLGAVRFGSAGWDADLLELLKGVGRA